MYIVRVNILQSAMVLVVVTERFTIAELSKVEATTVKK
jgi:hypothetical protein